MDVVSANVSDILRNITLDVDVHDVYSATETEIVSRYKIIAIVVGFFVVLSNLIVVVSSGLILRTGQQPKNTYILLGNVSLADTIIGTCLIYFGIGDRPLVTSAMCVFKTGTLVCPAIVSIFSVTLIAVDRYCYILHGLSYHRYFTTTRVRISIVLTWILGITLGFMPAVGWVNHDNDKSLSCTYLSLFPETLILFNSFLSVVALMLIAFLYSVILMNALRNITNIMATRIKDKTLDANFPSVTIEKQQIDYRKAQVTECSNKKTLKRSASFSSSRDFYFVAWANTNAQSKSLNDLITEDKQNKQRNSVLEGKTVLSTESEHSITSIDLSSAYEKYISYVDVSNKKRVEKVCKRIKDNIKNKSREPSKLRAVIVVSLTSGSIMITWLPFFVTIILYIFCKNKLTNVQCLQYESLLRPFLTLAFLNSLLNPLIYAWWHKGFKRSVKNIYQSVVNRLCPKHL